MSRVSFVPGLAPDALLHLLCTPTPKPTSISLSAAMGFDTPDRIAVDDAGNVYVTSNSSKKLIRVLKPDGMAWGNIAFPGQPSNAAFGDADRKTLYVTVGPDIYKVRLPIAGLL